MKEQPTRRQVLGHAVRGATLVGLGGIATYLSLKADAEGAWRINPEACVNSRLGALGVEVCERCATECVLPLSAVRAVNDHAKCGRCFVCPAYFDVKSAIDEQRMPSRKLCPRDAIERKVIGYVDPDDPRNNLYEYTIDEKLCNGCGKCVMACKEPAGLSSIRLEVRHILCLDCNRCEIANVCPDEAYERNPGS
ncbi:MAG: 4Fe-4S binding protein [Phycisphaerae bacterium]|nr:4Fe-4S binding protein [Phycisphaerae bacterium]